MRVATMRLTVSMALALLAAVVVVPAVSPPAAAAITGFRDVGANHKFHTEITWMVERNITNGYTAENRFKPRESVSREAFAAYLYRLAGRPSVNTPSSSPFRDVPTSSQFYREIVWLSQQGIAGGWSDGTFRPKWNITRDAMAAFLYRYEGSPSYTPPSSSPFRDVPRSAQFYKEIHWLRSTGMTTGYADSTFRPYDATSREATSAFLFRGYAPSNYRVPSMIYRPGNVLSVAAGEVGYREPSWRNSKYNQWNGTNNAWCHVYVQWVMNRAGFEGVVPRHGTFSSWVNILENSGVLTKNPSRSDLRPGTVVLFNWGSGTPTHTGIVNYVSGNGIWAYEGNTTSGTGDATRGVFHRYRNISGIYAVFDPLDYYKATR